MKTAKYRRVYLGYRSKSSVDNVRSQIRTFTTSTRGRRPRESVTQLSKKFAVTLDSAPGRTTTHRTASSDTVSARSTAVPARACGLPRLLPAAATPLYENARRKHWHASAVEASTTCGEFRHSLCGNRQDPAEGTYRPVFARNHGHPVLIASAIIRRSIVPSPGLPGHLLVTGWQESADSIRLPVAPTGSRH